MLLKDIDISQGSVATHLGSRWIIT